MDEHQQASQDIWKRLDEWANRSGVLEAGNLVPDLGDLYAAAVQIVNAVEKLTSDSKLNHREQGHLLLQIQAWLYEELLDHAHSMKSPLQSVIEQVYDVWENTDPPEE